MRDTLSMATDGIISKHNRGFNMATSGLLSSIILMAITFERPRRGGGTIIKINNKKQRVLIQDDKDMMLIVKLFLQIWD